MAVNNWYKTTYTPWLKTCAVLALGVSVALPTLAQTPPEPVDQIRSILKGFEQTPAERDKNLRGQTAKLATLQEVRLALELVEWHSPESGSPNARVDAQVRAELVDRLAEGYRQALSSNEKAIKTQLLTTLTECTKDRTSGRGVLDTCSLLTIELGRVACGTEPEQGVMAIELLGRVPVPASALVGLFEKALLPDSPMRRLAVSEAICEMLGKEIQTTRGTAGNPGRSLEQISAVLPLVLRLTQDEQVRVRRTSLDAAQKLGQLAHAAATDRSVLPAGEGELARDLASGNASRLTAGMAPRVLVCLRDTDAESRRKAQACLAELLRVRAALVEVNRGNTDPLGSVMTSCLRTLSEALRDPDTKVRRAALECLEILGKGAASCGATVLQTLDDPDSFVRWGAIRVLVALGSSAPAGTSEGIKTRLEDDDADVRSAAENALRRLRN